MSEVIWLAHSAVFKYLFDGSAGHISFTTLYDGTLLKYIVLLKILTQYLKGIVAQNDL